jgi:hypothetical protein
LKGGPIIMGLSDAQEFLMAADRAAQGHDYFQWRAVGRNLEWAEARTREVLVSLGGRKLVIVLSGEETRLLPSGRELARELRLKEAQRPTPPRTRPHR